jgi:mannose-6-phosphate isomerase-like protein (cupin superfamily)
MLIQQKSDPEQELKKVNLNKFDYHIVPVEQWHQISIPYDKSAHIIEIQYGEECKEDDIKRFVKNNAD